MHRIVLEHLDTKIIFVFLTTAFTRQIFRSDLIGS